MQPTTPYPSKVALGERLRAERRRQGLTQAAVAAALETDQKVISRAENGLATFDTQLRVATALGVDLMGAA